VAAFEMSRRDFATSLTAMSALVAMQGELSANTSNRPKKKICAFIKFVQSLSYDEMADQIAEIGFDGVESTVRRKGHVLPERVVDDLPRQQEALKRAGIEVTLMATNIVSVDTPHAESVLRTASQLGIRKYRMGYHHYDLKRPIQEQLDNIRPLLKELAALNRELGLTAVFHNHSGAKYVGAPIWDIGQLIGDIPKGEIDFGFDIRHATVEGGLAWPIHFQMARPRIGAIFVKDFQWAGPKVQDVALGMGQVDKKFFDQIRTAPEDWPVSLHVEYLHYDGIKKNMDALRNDFKKLRGWLDG